jgi:hypothetical protein
MYRQGLDPHRDNRSGVEEPMGRDGGHLIVLGVTRLIGRRLPFTRVRSAVAFVGKAFACVGNAIAFVGNTFAFVGSAFVAPDLTCWHAHHRGVSERRGQGGDHE